MPVTHSLPWRTFTDAVRRLRDDAASELVEFALSASVLIMLVFGLLAWCHAMYAYHFVSYIAQEGARFAMVRGADWSSSCSTSAYPNFTMPYSCQVSSTDVQNYVRTLAVPGIDPSQMTVTTTWPATTPGCTKSCTACSKYSNALGCYVNVQISYPFLLNVPFLSQNTLNFSGSSQKVIQY